MNRLLFILIVAPLVVLTFSGCAVQSEAEESQASELGQVDLITEIGDDLTSYQFQAHGLIIDGKPREPKWKKFLFSRHPFADPLAEANQNLGPYFVYVTLQQRQGDWILVDWGQFSGWHRFVVRKDLRLLVLGELPLEEANQLVASWDFDQAFRLDDYPYPYQEIQKQRLKIDIVTWPGTAAGMWYRYQAPADSFQPRVIFSEEKSRQGDVTFLNCPEGLKGQGVAVSKSTPSTSLLNLTMYEADFCYDGDGKIVPVERSWIGHLLFKLGRSGSSFNASPLLLGVALIGGAIATRRKRDPDDHDDVEE